MEKLLASKDEGEKMDYKVLVGDVDRLIRLARSAGVVQVMVENDDDRINTFLLNSYSDVLSVVNQLYPRIRSLHELMQPEANFFYCIRPATVISKRVPTGVELLVRKNEDGELDLLFNNHVNSDDFESIRGDKDINCLCHGSEFTRKKTMSELSEKLTSSSKDNLLLVDNKKTNYIMTERKETLGNIWLVNFGNVISGDLHIKEECKEELAFMTLSEVSNSDAPLTPASKVFLRHLKEDGKRRASLHND